MEYFGIDWEGPVNIDVDESELIIPETACPLTEVDLEEYDQLSNLYLKVMSME